MDDTTPKANILIVDDTPAKLQALESCLSGLDENIVTARSGREALQHVLKTDFAVILLDVQMPEMDGFETASLIRNRKLSAKTPIIFVTALGTSEREKARGYSVGAVDYIFQPVPAEIIKYKVERFVELYRMKRRIETQADALARSERFLFNIFESILDGISILDKDMNIVMANQTMERWYAHALPLVGKKCYAAYHGASQPCRPCPTIETLKTGKSAVEVVPMTGDGITIGWVELHSFPLTDRATGEITGVIEFVRNISEKKQLEEALRESELRHRSLIEHLPQRIFIKDRNLVYVTCNANYASDLGITPEQIVGKDDFAFYSPERSEAYRADDKACILNGMIQDIEEPYQAAGQEKMAHTIKVPYRNGQGEIIGVLGIFEDITDRVKAEGAKAFLASIVDSSGEAIIGKDLDGTILSWNKAAEKMYGFTAEEAKGRSIKMIIPPNRHSELTHLLETLGRGESITNLETIRVTKDGGEVPILLSVSPIKRSSGEILGASSIARDISEIKRYEAELLQAKELAEAGSKAKSAFLAIMSHELRTPLNSIIGFSEVLQDKTFGDLNAKQSKYVANVLTSSRHLLSLINDILDLAKIEAGKQELHRSDVKLREVMDECLAQLGQNALNRNQDLSLHAQGDLIVLADRRSLNQIVLNLLSNAVKFTPDGGKISVTVEKKSDELVLSVRDNGIGVKPEDQERIFERFEQIDSGTSRKYQGTGLGLPLTRELVELSGGKIWMESEGEGKGSVFSFTIPYAPEPTGEQTNGKNLC